MFTNSGSGIWVLPKEIIISRYNLRIIYIYYNHEQQFLMLWFYYIILLFTITTLFSFLPVTVEAVIEHPTSSEPVMVELAILLPSTCGKEMRILFFVANKQIHRK